MTIYLVGKSGALSGPVAVTVVPGLGAQLPAGAVELAGVLAPAEKGRAWAMVNGALVQLVDNRGAYYSTETGEPVVLEELGEVPATLTLTPRPDQFHVWDGKAWALDKAALAAHQATKEREWRDGEIAAHEWLVSRHRAERDLKRATALTEERYIELLEYLQALRDWPAAGAFPADAQRPVSPTWIAEQVK